MADIQSDQAQGEPAHGEPPDGAAAPPAIQTTPLHGAHIGLGARMVPFAGYEMPVQYPTGVLAEHLHTRASAGLFDVSHMGQGFLMAPDHETAARALETRWMEGTIRGFPVVRDADGHQIGEGTLTQYIEDGKLHAQGIFDLRDGRRLHEEVVLEQRPRLRQLSWSWEETKGGEVLRRFSVDLTTGHAVARKRNGDGVDTWDDHLDGTREAFAGVGFMYAVKNLTERLDKGEKIEVTAVVFTAKPRTVTVSISRDQVGELAMGGRRLPAARYVIHPDVPWFARLFVKAPDQYLWYYRPDPPAFLRADIPVAEPGDPMIRIELLPGTESRAVGRAPRRHR